MQSTFRLIRTMTLSVPAAIGLALFAGPARCGTIDMYCDCTPNINMTVSGEKGLYCECDNSNTFSGLATHQFDRHCSAPDTLGWSVRQAGVDAPLTQMRNIPSNMTCTAAASREQVPDYYYNQCTNWNFSKKSATVITYCAKCLSGVLPPC